MKKYLMGANFIDDEFITITFNSIEEMQSWHEEMKPYIKNVVLAISFSAEKNNHEVEFIDWAA